MITGSKKSRKEKKSRRSSCGACSSDKEQKDHKKDKKRSKKDQSKRKKVTINSDTESKKTKRPPMPKSEDLGPVRDGFFKQLLITNEAEKQELIQAASTSQIQRSSRQTQRKVLAHRPSFNTFLKEKKAVTDSKFCRRDSTSPIERTGKILTPGTLQGEQYFENRSKFENGMKPVATFPRSLSNLERRTNKEQKEDSIRDVAILSIPLVLDQSWVSREFLSQS